MVEQADDAWLETVELSDKAVHTTTGESGIAFLSYLLM